MDALRRHLSALADPPRALFDEAFYLAEHPDVAAMVQAGRYASGFEHYGLDGYPNRRPHWLFDPARYQAAYPDLTPEALAAAGFANLYDHFLRTGAREGRRGHDLFDARFYLGQLAGGDADARDDPFGHYLAALSGAAEPRCSPYHDPEWYRAAYPDASTAIEAGAYRGALHHYLTTPGPHRFDPLCDFSEAEYAALHPDVAHAVRRGTFRNGYEHFLRHGAAELRQPAAHIDLRHYVAANPAVRADLDAGRQPDAFAHLLQVGLARGLSFAPKPPEAPQDEAAARALFLAQAEALRPLYARRPLDFTLAGPPAVSVIVALHNQFALAMQSLASLREHPGPIELILVDNASSDETSGIEAYVRGARLLRFDTNIGFVRGCNAALPHATAPAILYLNSDVRLAPGCLDAALRRLAGDPGIGAVGAKVVRTHGRLQEAGCLLWRDGSAQGYLRDASPNAPEANFVRDVEFCSGVFLLVRGDLLRRLGGFDDAFAPAYYEEVDLCVRIRAAGFRVVYDPAAMLTHYEYGSARSARSAVAGMLRGRRVFAAKHAAMLATRPDNRARLAHARAVGGEGRRVLFVEDTVPLRRLGSGFGRANDLVRAMGALGCRVTVFPVHGAAFPLAEMLADLPDTVELLHDRTAADLPAHLQERRGFYDHAWVSRTHNLAHLAAALPVGERDRLTLTLDTEAVVSMRRAGQAALAGTPFDLARAAAEEFADAAGCDHVVAVSKLEATLLRSLGLASVPVVGFCRELTPTARGWAGRAGLLFVGSVHADSPNLDGLSWFVGEVLPRVHELLGEAVPLRIAGNRPASVSLAHLAATPGVELLGGARDLAPLYDAHRVFVAPTRFAAGAPYKVFEAASFGLPVAATRLLQGQLGWTDGAELLAADPADPAGFARNVALLYRSEEAWSAVRSGALARLRRENSPDRLADAVAGVLGLSPPARPRAVPRPRRAAAGSSAG